MKKKAEKIYKMRTIREIAKTGIMRESVIRSLVKDKKIKYITSGNRIYINYNHFVNYIEKIS